MKIRFLLLATIVATSFSLHAETYVMDPTHSTIGFEVRNILSKVSGKFDTYEGTVQFNAEKPEESGVTASIDTASINTGITDRDNHLRSPDFLETEKYPKMTFVSKSIKITGEKTGEITGDLTLKDVTKEVTLKVEFIGDAVDMDGKAIKAWSATTTINRKDFNVNWGKIVEGMAVVGDEVEVKLEITGKKQ